MKEVNNLVQRKLINGCANITGGGLINNLMRVIPNNYSANIDLSKIKVTKIFKWLKKNNISDVEMLNTFNCGVGFCLIANESKLQKIKKYFKREYSPYVIGYISKNKVKSRISGKILW